MIRIFNIKDLLKGAALAAIALSFAVFFLQLLFGAPMGLNTALRSFMAGSSILGVSLLVLNFNPIWRRLWRWFPQFSEWVMPDLNGRWVGTNTSNYEMHRRRIAAQKGEEAPLEDRIYYSWKENPEYFTHIDTEYEIKHNLFDFSIELVQSSKTESTSQSRACGVKRNPVVISYLYRSENLQHEPGDDREYFGAGELTLRIDQEGHQTLEGLYWTNRTWRQGKNAAGWLKLSRVSE